MTAFTYQWTNRCRLAMLAEEGRPLGLAAGDAFVARGVAAGDRVYVVAVNAGKLHLIGRMRVARVCSRSEWEAANSAADLWPGEEVLVGTAGTPMRFHRTLPTAVLRQLRFQDRKGKVKPLNVDEHGWFDPQAVRSVRRLTPAAAGLLDAQLG